ncbi:MAG: caspase family protein [Caldilineaceae bacterium]|nr:caspase family protein [Caldilineaceae bacterium]
MANRLFALLVGIDRYANPHQAPHLRGCVADVEGTYALLTGRFGLPAAQIRILTARLDQSEPAADRATRANMLHAWQEHLAQAQSGDVALFHYSGHGSQARTGDPADAAGYEATLVPHDSRTPGVFDLTGRELAALVRQVGQRSAQVILWLDCGHPPRGPRRGSAAGVRGCTADDRLRPRMARLPGADAFAPSAGRATPSGWLPLGDHLLLAACRAGEVSHELAAPGIDALGGAERWQGALSYFVHQALAAAAPETTWAQLHQSVLNQLHAVYPHQSPQLEGPGDLPLWGSVDLPMTSGLHVLAVEGGEYVQVSGGTALGLTPGTRLAIDPPAGETVRPQDEPLAYGLVEEVQVDHAWAKLDRLADLPPEARVRTVALGWATPFYRVQTAIAQVRQALATGERSPFLLLVDDTSGDTPDNGPTHETATDCAPADFVVIEEDGLYLLRDGTGEPLAELQPPATAEGALHAVAMLEHIAVYRNIQRLANPLGGTPAARLALDAVTYSQVGRSGRPLDPAPPYDRGHSAILDDGQKLQVTVHNRSDAPVYITVLNLDADYGITRIYPARAGYHLLQPQSSAVLEPLEPRVTGLGRTQSRQTLKVMATRVPLSFDVLQLPKLAQGDARAGTRAAEENALGQLLNGVRRQGLHDLLLPADESAEQWAALHLELTVMGRPAGQPLVAGATQVEAADGWVIEKPAGFEGEWLVSNLELATRGLDGTARLRLPPGLDTPDAAAFFRPVVSAEATRGTDRTPVVVGLAAAGDHLASISPLRPLRVELPVDDEPDLAGIVPIAYDGQFFYPAGLPAPLGSPAAALPGRRRLACEIHFLPPPVEAGDDPVGRDLQRTVRLYFYKVFGRSLPAAAGLRQADLADSRAVYRAVNADEVGRARRVALMLHGITGDTRWMVERVWPWVQTAGEYDLCLAYDYDALGTGLRRSAQLLAGALQQAGIGAGDALALDIFAHGAGSQVARALVELLGGDAYTDRLLMGGPPNAGLPLARGRSLLPWLITLMLNRAGAVPPAPAAAWLLERFTTAAPGLADLEPESRFFEELNAPWRVPANVPYFIQIGDNSHGYPQAKTLVRRLMQGIDLGLDALLSGDNDLVVRVDSARALDTRRPRLEVAQLGVDHFHYFEGHDPGGRDAGGEEIDGAEGQRILARWITP